MFVDRDASCHDRYIMNMHNAPPTSTCNICCMKMISIHHTLSYILSWYHSDIYQDVSPEPKSTKLKEQSICWLEMYGQPDIELVFLVWNSTGTVRWYCVEACISLENSILGILWLRVLITEKRQLVWRLIWHFDIEVLFISVWTVSCVCVWVYN